MKRSILLLAAAAILGGSATAATAAARAWELDNAHSGFYFTIDHIFSKVRGHFGEFSGTVNFDPGNLAESSFSFTIKVDSIDTAIAKRDKHLLSADFFDASSYPEMTFVSSSISDEGNGDYLVKGTFTVKGKAYELDLPLNLPGVKEHPAKKGKDVAGFNGYLTIDRLQYGVGSGKFVDLGVVGREVDILVTLELLADR